MYSVSYILYLLQYTFLFVISHGYRLSGQTISHSKLFFKICLKNYYIIILHIFHTEYKKNHHRSTSVLKLKFKNHCLTEIRSQIRNANHTIWCFPSQPLCCPPNLILHLKALTQLGTVSGITKAGAQARPSSRKQTEAMNSHCIELSENLSQIAPKFSCQQVKNNLD